MCVGGWLLSVTMYCMSGSAPGRIPGQAWGSTWLALLRTTHNCHLEQWWDSSLQTADTERVNNPLQLGITNASSLFIYLLYWASYHKCTAENLNTTPWYSSSENAWNKHGNKMLPYHEQFTKMTDSLKLKCQVDLPERKKNTNIVYSMIYSNLYITSSMIIHIFSKLMNVI